LFVVATLGAKPMPWDMLQFVEMVNASRFERGVKPLVIDLALVATARAFLQNADNLGEWGHSLWTNKERDIRSPYEIWGEDLLRAPEWLTCEQVFVAFKNSPSHWSLLMDSDFSAIGVALSERDTGVYIWFYCVHMGGN
jgi:uncharacterized protein YkwD